MPILNWKRRIMNSQGRLQGVQGNLESKSRRGVPVENEVLTCTPCPYLITWYGRNIVRTVVALFKIHCSCML